MNEMIEEIRDGMEPWDWLDEDKVDQEIMNWCENNDVPQSEIEAVFDYCAKNLY